MSEEWWRIGGAFVKVEPGAEFKDSVKLDWRNFPDLRSPGVYSFTYDFSYKPTWDGTKVGLWKGKVPELNVAVEVQADAAKEQPGWSGRR